MPHLTRNTQHVLISLLLALVLAACSPPRPPAESVLGAGLWARILRVGVVIAAVTLAVAVAEIDKEVTKIAHEDFYLKDTPGIKIVNKDARPVLRDMPKNQRFDVILGDAYGDLAIPYHLVTRQFDELVKSRLKPDGIFMANIIDGVHYDFLRSFIHTAKQVFPYVDLDAVPGEGTNGQRATFVVAASSKPIPRIQTTADPEQLNQFLRERKATTLTDDHVPVDQLLAPVFRQRLQEPDDTAISQPNQ